MNFSVEQIILLVQLVAQILSSLEKIGVDLKGVQLTTGTPIDLFKLLKG